MPNTFDLITQDQILDVIGNLTSYFFLAMIALSSVALLVGGIGVMAIMMVSVSDRTKEIGLRKALGATRREMLWQFLVEAATLTLLGGAARHRVRSGRGQLLKAAMGLESAVPLWSIGVGLRGEHRDRARLRPAPGQPGGADGSGRGAAARVRDGGTARRPAVAPSVQLRPAPASPGLPKEASCESDAGCRPASGRVAGLRPGCRACGIR